MTTLPELFDADIGDVNLKYIHYRGTGPTIVFLHATGFLPWLWHPIAREFLPDYNIIAPYFCDHRDSDPEDGGLSWVTLAGDLYRLCVKLEIKNPYFVGHSMGGTIITLINALHGYEINKMVLIEPVFLPEQIYNMKLRVQDHPLASKSIKRRNQWKDKNEAYDYLRSKKLFQKWDEEMLKLYIDHGMVESHPEGIVLACSPRREASLFMGSTNYNPWPLIPEIKCPVLIIEGEESENKIFIDYKKAASNFPNGSYMLIKKAGHLIPMEKPGELTEIIKNFLQGDN